MAPALALLALLWAGCSDDRFPGITGGGDLPNVVVYLVDTLRADHLGVYGYERPTSPRLDALADRSVVFEEASAPAPWTLPSVVSLMTSTFPCEHGVTSQGRQVSPALRTLAEELKENGYNTASLFANQYAGAFAGLDRGFDVTHLMGLKARRNPEKLLEMLLEDPPPGPLFLYIHTVEPHDPYHPPDELLSRFGSVDSETRGRINALSRRYRTLTNVDWREGRPVGTTDNTEAQVRTLAVLARSRDDVLDLYDASIRQADRRMGRVLDMLQRFGEWENTLFVFLSDHGEELGEHGGWQHDHSLFEELVHVPLLIRFPADFQAGRRISGPVSLVNLVPTVLDALGVEIPATVRGKSLLPRLEDGDPDRGADTEDLPVPMAVRVNEEKYFRPWHRLRGDRNVALREGDFKGIVNLDPRTLELYDLEGDSGELRNVAERHPEMTHRMVSTARSWWTACESRQREHGAVRREESLPNGEIDELRALGYVQ